MTDCHIPGDDAQISRLASDLIDKCREEGYVAYIAMSALVTAFVRMNLGSQKLPEKFKEQLLDICQQYSTLYKDSGIDSQKKSTSDIPKIKRPTGDVMAHKKKESKKMAKEHEAAAGRKENRSEKHRESEAKHMKKR
jgi:hypothetical protein